MNEHERRKSIHCNSVFSHTHICKGEVINELYVQYVLTFIFHLPLPVVGYSANERDIVLYW